MSFLINIGILLFFKYSNFVINNLNSLLSVFGIFSNKKSFDIILPVGISFYTFQALSYTMDVYRGEIKAEKNFFRYALFVSFFPQLVAGPIERSKNLLTQISNIEKINVWELKRICRGGILILWGLFQKMVIADRSAIVVDQVYDNYWMYGTIELLLATILFAIQIYCDFSSYSFIAMGTAKIMGFVLMDNFNSPYTAQSIHEFWRRWHISLSTWLRDYLYIPLGGSRCSKIKKYRNIMITFLVSGIWHGANWNFIIWGGLHGVYQIIEDISESWEKNMIQKYHVKFQSFSYKLGKIIVTFCLVDFAWIFFRSTSIKYSFDFIRRMITCWNPWVLFDQSLYNLGIDQKEVQILIIALVILFLVDIIKDKKNLTLDIFLENQCIWFKWGCIYFLFFFILVYGVYGPSFDANQFIYFQF